MKAALARVAVFLASGGVLAAAHAALHLLGWAHGF